ncbi:MAG: hypothetical protein JXA78_00020 [Anaerolineales bacterium]|nr:hypothetical protein [Anaerolineales bacterium]
MYNNQIFLQGVHSILLVCWPLRCETPLAIRNGMSITYHEPKVTKGRGLGLKFMWQASKDNTSHDVATLHYGYEIEGSKVISHHFVPPSSVRGALRSWTVNHLVHPDFRSHMSPPVKEDEQKTEQYLDAVRTALADPSSGYQIIASLFGSAVETRIEVANLSNAGRLNVETEKFSHAKAQPIAINGVLDQGEVGPTNAKRQMSVRNPLDRITHASKEPGLHHFLEFCRGETFVVQLSIINPESIDLGILSLWARELNDGLIRIGALSNIGRGRVSIVEPSYSLWCKRGFPEFSGFDHFFETNERPPGEVFLDLWRSYSLDAAKLVNFEPYLR